MDGATVCADYKKMSFAQMRKQRKDEEIHNNILGGGCTHYRVRPASRAGSVPRFNLLDSKLNKKRVLSQGCLPLWNRTHVRYNFIVNLYAHKVNKEIQNMEEN